MSIELTKLNEENRSAVYDSLLQFWSLPWDEDFSREFLTWRYGARRHGETLVAMSGDKCVGMIDTFIRPYRVGAASVMVREPCDWYSQPGHRGTGLRLMKYLMAQGEPLLGVGLPRAAVTIVPKMKWRHLTDTREFILPISLRRVAGAVLRKVKLGNGSLAAFIPRGIRIRSKAALVSQYLLGGKVSSLEAESFPELAVPGDYSLAPLLTEEYYRWLLAAPTRLGDVFGLVFHSNDVPVGLTLNRIEESRLGRRAKIIHIHAAQLSVPLLAWMVSATIATAIDQGAESVHCRSSCPVICSVLSSLHFVEVERQEVITWFNGIVLPDGLSNIALLRGDDAMIPPLIDP